MNHTFKTSGEVSIAIRQLGLDYCGNRVSHEDYEARRAELVKLCTDMRRAERDAQRAARDARLNAA